ncbi:MAG: helix-turn-helix domain-containing protein [Saccharofermentanales bacterium]|jgi:transcriptional regulator with XRE-family HTH domain|nr:XRE family transcriptional regulator [Bacillota bacterium]
MDLAQNIGQRIKAIRNSRDLTLKQLSEMTGLSSGFLSQFERGMTNIAIDSLNQIAKALGVPLESLLKLPPGEQGIEVIRSYQRDATFVSPQIIQYILSSQPEHFTFLPRLYTLLPLPEHPPIELYSHEGQEFLYVLDGSITFYLEDETTVLYAGDSVQIDSSVRHNWTNHTSLPATLLTINSPNPYSYLEEIHGGVNSNSDEGDL